MAIAASERITTKDTATVGSGTVVNKSLLFDVGAGVSNPSLLYKTSDASLNLNKNVLGFGDGTASDKTITADKGAGANNPKLRYNNTTSKWQFSDDGSSFTNLDAAAAITTYAWSGYHSIDCSFLFSGGGGAYIEATADSSCTFAQITNVNFGSVTSYNDGTPGNNRPGIVFTPPATGTYEVCTSYTTQQGSGANSEQLTDGTTVMSIVAGRDVGGSGIEAPATQCGFLVIASLVSTTVKIIAQGTHSILNNSSASPGYTMVWRVKRIGP